MEWEAADKLKWTYKLKLEVIISTDNANNYDLHLGNLIYYILNDVIYWCKQHTHAKKIIIDIKRMLCYFYNFLSKYRLDIQNNIQYLS